MDVTQALEYVAGNHRAVLATMRSDGTPQLSPVLCTVDAERHVVVSTTEKSVKVRNLRREPRAWLCVLSDRFFGDWVWLEGEVEIVTLPEAMDLLVDYYRSVSGEHSDWEDYRASMEREGRVLVRISVTRAGPSAR